MSKLVQHIKMDMQEPLEKLYEYENQPDMREKVKEYMADLESEINRCMNFIEYVKNTRDFSHGMN